VNINLLKLVIGMQLELRTIIQKAGDMEKTLREIMEGAEQEQRAEFIHSMHPPAKLKLASPKKTHYATPAGRKLAAEKAKKYWASPAGQARKAKSKANSERVTA